MTKQQLTEIIRKVVQEEIRTQLPSMLIEMIAQNSGGQKVVTEARAVAPAPRPPARPAPPAPKKEPVMFVKNNPALNAILNETVGGVPPDNSIPMASMGDGPTLLGEGVEIPDTAAPEVHAVAQVIKKDFRGLMKAMDKKRQNRGPSNINFSAPVPQMGNFDTED